MLMKILRTTTMMSVLKTAWKTVQKTALRSNPIHCSLPISYQDSAAALGPGTQHGVWWVARRSVLRVHGVWLVACGACRFRMAVGERRAMSGVFGVLCGVCCSACGALRVVHGECSVARDASCGHCFSSIVGALSIQKRFQE